MNRNIKLKEVVLSESEFDNIEKKLEEYEKLISEKDLIFLRTSKFSYGSTFHQEELITKDEAILEIKKHYEDKVESLNQTINIYKCEEAILEEKIAYMKSKWYYKLFN